MRKIVAPSALNPLGIAALALLAERPMHPYEMFQTLMLRREDRIVKVRPGSLYHAINRLETDGLIRTLGTEREGNRPERTTYAITTAGRDALLATVTEMIAEPVNEYPRFPLAIGEAHNLPLETVVGLLEQRLSLLRAARAEGEGELEGVRARGLPRKFWLDGTYLLAMNAAEIAWISGVLDELRSGALPWEHPDYPPYSPTEPEA